MYIFKLHKELKNTSAFGVAKSDKQPHLVFILLIKNCFKYLYLFKNGNFYFIIFVFLFLHKLFFFKFFKLFNILILLVLTLLLKS